MRSSELKRKTINTATLACETATTLASETASVTASEQAKCTLTLPAHQPCSMSPGNTTAAHCVALVWGRRLRSCQFPPFGDPTTPPDSTRSRCHMRPSGCWWSPADKSSRAHTDRCSQRRPVHRHTRNDPRGTRSPHHPHSSYPRDSGPCRSAFRWSHRWSAVRAALESAHWNQLDSTRGCHRT